ncbi:DsrH family protein [Paraglaciecola sp. T6c]|uniref:sulfurtransferase complex subunit TusB n=1 Tax=Pseudoalteromonas atlantica (strain T6c / ATCC BAA-1087) TaxID=3042615 RepID=UPI00005C6DF6|nr:sulfurtransferase complex subunit TusB [Paraglaciecola sp. T6c]ABG40970.1 DsrH family protein [Paraglaciecola sp. T6c]
MTLHIVSTSPFSSTVFESVFKRCNNGDGIMLIQDGAYALNHVDVSHQLRELSLSLGITCFVLEDDVVARANHLKSTGTNSKLIKSISMEGFVALTLGYKTTISW